MREIHGKIWPGPEFMIRKRVFNLSGSSNGISIELLIHFVEVNSLTH